MKSNEDFREGEFRLQVNQCSQNNGLGVKTGLTRSIEFARKFSGSENARGRGEAAWWALSFILASALAMVCGLALGMAEDWHGMVWPGINEVLALAVACVSIRRL